MDKHDKLVKRSDLAGAMLAHAENAHDGFRSQPELLRHLRTFINRRRDALAQVKCYFHEESVKYAAA